MATCFNPIHFEKKIDLINRINKIKSIKIKESDNTILNFNKLIKEWLGNNTLPNNIKDIKNIKKKEVYIENIVTFLKTDNELDINKLYWDIEAQQFLIE